MNTVNLIGRLTREFDLKQLQNNMSIARNTLAVTRRTTNANGVRETDFINVLAFGKTAEILSQYFSKGQLIGIQGRIQTGQYDNQQGHRIYTTDVIVENFDFIEKRQADQSTQPHHVVADYNRQATPPQHNAISNADNTLFSEDDLPF